MAVLVLTATKNMPCPYCLYPRFWRLRRQHARCKSCKKEYSLRIWIAPGIKATEVEWREVLDSFLRDWTLNAVARETGMKLTQLHKMLTLVRLAMTSDRPPRFRGPVEADEAFLGPRWHNRRRWQYTTRKGRGTDKQPVIGIFDQNSGKVAATLIPKVEWLPIHTFLTERARQKIMLYTDTYSAYHPSKRSGYDHEVVDHLNGEYARGEVTVNHIESFWGYMKRRFKVTGGLRRNRLNLYLGEWVWRYNHRNISREAKVKRLLNLLKELQISGRKH